MTGKRILVTGSRDWTNETAVWNALDNADWEAWQETPGDITLVHGACPSGADAIADHWAKVHCVFTERHPAEWQKYGKRAGFRRNAEMVELGADLCLAFIRDGSRGATHTADLAEKAGIPVRRFKS